MWWMWILAALVCGIVEVMAISFVFLMLAIGALAAGIAGALGASLAVQMIIFVVVAVALLFVVRPFLKGRVERSTPDVRTNADALIGRTGYVTEIVGERNGRIQFSGGEWSARTEGPSIPVGVEVCVERIDGATAVVSALNPTGGPTNPYAGHVS